MKRHAWGIQLDSSGTLAGIWYFARVQPLPYHDGLTIALFRTRQQARTAFAERQFKSSWPKARVVGVTLTFEINK